MNRAAMVDGEPACASEVSDGVASTLPDDFDVVEWTRAACEASRVPFAVEDPVTLAKLRDLAEHPA